MPCRHMRGDRTGLGGRDADAVDQHFLQVDPVPTLRHGDDRPPFPVEAVCGHDPIILVHNDLDRSDGCTEPVSHGGRLCPYH
jgi:hypothetical protein